MVFYKVFGNLGNTHYINIITFNIAIKIFYQILPRLPNRTQTTINRGIILVIANYQITTKYKFILISLLLDGVWGKAPNLSYKKEKLK